MRLARQAIFIFIETCAFPFLCLAALVARLVPKRFDVGLGPEPLINNVYHKKALELQGYTVETFVSDTYFITQEFDYIAFRKIGEKHPNLSWTMKGVYRLRFMWLFLRSLFRYRCIYIYFNGGPLGVNYRFWKIEPYLYKLAGIKVVVMPYGGDIQDLMECPNLFFRHAMALQYPGHRLMRHRVQQQVDLWTRHADYVLSGCDWVYYMYYWNRLMLAHFSIDTERWQPSQREREPGSPLRVLHAPNHRLLKGSAAFMQAIEELQEEGVPIELVVLEKQPNHMVKQKLAEVDVVADQLVIGWYAMMALEAMAMAKPVICYLDPKLVDLYEKAGLVQPGEIPLISATQDSVKDTLRDLAERRDALQEIGQRSREYVCKYHSVESIGQVFAEVNEAIGLSATGEKQRISHPAPSLSNA